MSKFLSGRERELKIGIVSYTENNTVLEVVGNANITGIVTASSFSGIFSGNATSATFATNAGIATNLKGGVAGNVPYQSATDTTTFVTNGSPGQVLLFNGSTPIWGNVSAASGSFGGITIYDEGNLVGTASSITALNFVSPNLTVTGTSGANGIATITMSDNLVGTALSISGISTLGSVQISSGIITATSGVVTYYGDGSQLTGISSPPVDGQDFNTGITSSLSATLTGLGVTVLTLPATSGKQYIVYSIHASNVATGNTEVNVIGAFDYNGGERTYFGYNIPIPTGTAVEMLKQPHILNPSDRITMRSTDYNRAGIDTGVEVYITYQERTSSDYFGVGLGTVGIGLTTPISIHTATTYPSIIESINLVNRTDTGAYPVSITVTSGVVTTYLINNLIVPKYGAVEILDTPKRLNVNDVLSIQVDQTGTIDVQVSGKKVV